MASKRPRPLVLALLGAVVLGWAAIATVVVFAYVKTSAFASHVASQLLPEMSKELGYEIRLGKVEANLLPRPRVELTDVVVGGSSTEPALLVANHVSVDVALGPLLRSLGDDIRLSTAQVEGAAVSVCTRRDGSFNLDKLVDYWAAQGKKRRSWQLDVATIRPARLFLFDLRERSQPLLVVDSFDAEIRPRAGKAELELRGGLASDSPNASSRLTLEGRTIRGSFQAKGVDVARLKGALPGRLAELAAGGTLRAQGELSTDNKGRWVVEGNGAIDALQILKHQVNASFAVRTALELRPSPPSVMELPKLAFDRFVVGALEVREVHAKAVFTRASLGVTELEGSLAGGTLNVASLELSPGDLSWTLSGSTKKADITELGRRLDVRMPVSGKCSGSFNVRGTGGLWDSIRPTLVGTGRFDIEEAAASAGTTAALARPIRSTLDATGLGALFPQLGAMSLGPFGAPFHVANGKVTLDKPVALRTHLGDAVLGGSIGLDQKLLLAGSAALRWKPFPNSQARTATFPVSVSGTLSEPVVQVTATPQQVVRAISGAMPTLGDMREEAKRQLEKWLTIKDVVGPLPLAPQ